MYYNKVEILRSKGKNFEIKSNFKIKIEILTVKKVLRVTYTSVGSTVASNDNN